MKSDLKVGQVRKLDSIKGIADSRLVTIAEIDSGDATCLVFLLNNMVEAATPRDVCIPQILAGSNYDLVLMSDYLSRVDQARLVNNEVLGQLDKNLIQQIRDSSFSQPYGGLSTELTTLGVLIGGYPAQKYDSVWYFRDNEFENFSKLTFIRNPISVDHATRFYINNKENMSAFLGTQVPFDALRYLSITQSRITVSA